MTFNFKFTFGGSDNSDNAKKTTDNKDDSKVVLSCKGNECVYSQKSEDHPADSSVEGKWVGDVFQIHWEH